MVSIVAGVNGNGTSGSYDMGKRGRALMIEETSANNVESISWVNCLTSSRIVSSIRLTTPIIRSQIPPMWEEWGVLKIQLIPFSFKYCLIGRSSTLIMLMFKSFTDPMKFVPQSECIILTSPLIAQNRLSAFIKHDDVISSSISM